MRLRAYSNDDGHLVQSCDDALCRYPALLKGFGLPGATGNKAGSDERSQVLCREFGAKDDKQGCKTAVRSLHNPLVGQHPVAGNLGKLSIGDENNKGHRHEHRS